MGGQHFARAALPSERDPISIVQWAHLYGQAESHAPGIRTQGLHAHSESQYWLRQGRWVNIKMNLKEIVCNDVDWIQWAKGNITVRQVPIKVGYFRKIESNYSSDLRTIPTDWIRRCRMCTDLATLSTAEVHKSRAPSTFRSVALNIVVLNTKSASPRYH